MWPIAAAAAAGLTLAVPLVGVLAAHGGVVADPFVALWNGLPGPLREFLAAWADWTLLLALLGTATYLAWRLGSARRWREGARVAIIGIGGGFAVAFVDKMMRAWPRSLRGSVLVGAVVPSDRVRGQEAVGEWFAWLHPLRVVYKTKPGESPEASFVHHKVASRSYAPAFARLARQADRVIRVVSLGGMTGTMTAAFTKLGSADRPVLGVVVGDTPLPLLRAISDPRLYARARAALTQAAAEEGGRLPWTDGAPEVVEVSA